MGREELVRIVQMDCPFCDKIHEVEERKRLTTAHMKGEEVTYEERFYFCANTDEDENEFETGAMLNENLLNARNAYRRKHGLLTSDEIVSIRESYGLSQVDLARLMGWGEATISRYESKAIQDESYDIMLRLVQDNPMITMQFFNKNEMKFAFEKRMAIRQRIVEKMDAYGREYLGRQKLKGEYLNYEQLTDLNGYTELDIDKIEVVMSYFATAIDNLYKVKLMKMLWYADVLSYNKTGKSMTGLVYRHGTMGALPIGHYSIMSLENVNMQEEFSGMQNCMLHVYANDNMDYSILNKEEMSILDKIIDKFKDFSTKDIVDYMHREEAYTATTQGEIISFDLAKSIRKF